MAPLFAKRFGSLARHRIVGEVRTAGLMGALELVRDRASKEPFTPDLAVPARIRAAALRQGVIVRASADTVVVCPPLIVTRAELDRLVDTLDAALEEVGTALVAEGVLA